MTDPVSDPGKPATQPPATPPASQPAAEPVAQEPVFSEAQLAAIEKISERKAQSFADKAADRVSKEAQAKIEALNLNKDTLGLTDDQVKEARQKIVLDDLAAPAKPATPSEPGSGTAPAGDQTPVPPIIQETIGIFEEEQVTIEQGDPEFKELADALQDPNGSRNKYIRTLHRLIDVKKERLQTAADTADARSPSGGGGQTPASNVAGPDKTGLDYLRQAHSGNN